MSAKYEWTTLKVTTPARQEYPSFEVSNHPLKSKIPTTNTSITRDFMENLNKWSSQFEETDPLMRFEQMNLNEAQHTEGDVIEVSINYSNAWNTKRLNILHKYTTGEKLTIVSSYLPGGERALIRQVSNLNEKVKHRLEQLDEFDEGTVRKTIGLSQQEFTSNISVLNDEIKKAWNTDQKVKAFKIAIQCSKLLSDINVMQFYPSKLVLITDILDMFGELVFDRLKEKSFGKRVITTIQEIEPNQVPEAAKETCRNWMYKMSSIRELLPRLYIEIALLKCYAFTSKCDIKPAITRLTKMIRGISNPLVAVYLRLHLCRVASKLFGAGCEDIYYENFKEFLDDYPQIFHIFMRSTYEKQALPLDKYLSLYMPAIDWLLFGTLNSNKCKISLLDEFLQQCEKMENSELLLYCLLSSFDSKSVIEKSTRILELVQINADSMVMLPEILASLGKHLCGVDIYHHHTESETLIQTWWKIATNIKSPSHFLQVLEPWLEFACRNLSSQHVNIILRGTIRYMIKCGKPADEFSGGFQFVIKRMLKSLPDIEELFLMDAFMPVVELVQTPSARTMMAKTVLSIFFARYTSGHIEDHVVIGDLMRLCCILHESINAVTVEDESKVRAELICKYIQAVSYQDNYEQQLNFYVECRSSFIKLDAVLIALVHAVNALAVRAGSAGATTAWLQRACAAYCFITVPSLHCVITKLQLYLLSGQVALLNKCIGQAESNFKAVVSLIPDIPEYILEDGQKKQTWLRVTGLMSDFLSTLLILPDNVDSNCKAYVLSGLIKTLERIHWRKTDVLYYTTLLHTLDLLCSMTQESFSYHIDSVLSNDVLYGSDSEFIEIIEKYATNVCQELLVVLKALADANETKKQSALSLELFWRVATKAELERDAMFGLAVNLWMLHQKIRDPHSSRLAKSMLSVLDSDQTPSRKKLLKKLEESSKWP